jgi:RNA polymerase sigma-70 factor (ECF subfamily)
MLDDPDPDVLRRFEQGELRAFEVLFKQFEVEVYRWIVRIVRDRSAADDLLVEAFWRAYRGRARFDPGRSFGAWMRRIATNVACDHLNRRNRREETLGDQPVPASAGPDRGVREALALAFRALPVRLRVVATLALIEGQPYAEIADALDLPVGTVKSRVFRATRALREELGRLGIQP